VYKLSALRHTRTNSQQSKKIDSRICGSGRSARSKICLSKTKTNCQLPYTPSPAAIPVVDGDELTRLSTAPASIGMTTPVNHQRPTTASKIVSRRLTLTGGNQDDLLVNRFSSVITQHHAATRTAAPRRDAAPRYIA